MYRIEGNTTGKYNHVRHATHVNVNEDDRASKANDGIRTYATVSVCGPNDPLDNLLNAVFLNYGVWSYVTENIKAVFVFIRAPKPNDGEKWDGVRRAEIQSVWGSFKTGDVVDGLCLAFETETGMIPRYAVEAWELTGAKLDKRMNSFDYEALNLLGVHVE